MKGLEINRILLTHRFVCLPTQIEANWFKESMQLMLILPDSVQLVF